MYVQQVKSPGGRDDAGRRETQRHYDQHKRNRQAVAFYNSAAWQRARAAALTRDNHLCQPCLRRKHLTPATTVHHIKSLEEAPELALDLDNLESICESCHNKEHPEKGAGEQPERERRVRVIVMEANPEIV